MQGCHGELLPSLPHLSPTPKADVQVLLSILAHHEFYFNYQRVAESFQLNSRLPECCPFLPLCSLQLQGVSGFNVRLTPTWLLTRPQQQRWSREAEYLPPVPKSHPDNESHSELKAGT